MSDRPVLPPLSVSAYSATSSDVGSYLRIDGTGHSENFFDHTPHNNSLRLASPAVRLRSNPYGRFVQRTIILPLHGQSPQNPALPDDSDRQAELYAPFPPLFCPAPYTLQCHYLYLVTSMR